MTESAYGQYGFAFGDVESVGLHLRTEHLRLAHGLGESVAVDVAESELRALSGEVECQRPADSGTGSRDDGDFAFE